MPTFQKLIDDAYETAKRESHPFTPSRALIEATVQSVVDVMLHMPHEAVRKFVAGGAGAGTYGAVAVRMYKEQRLNYIRDERGRPANEAFIKKQFGITSKKLPPDEFAGRYIQHIFVWIEPAPNPVFRSNGKRVKSSRHRVMCRCPKCGAVMSVGRIAQHLCKSGFEHY